MATITCADCGDERRGTPKNTLYCKRCRALRDLDHWRLLTRRCAQCREPFAPLGRTDMHCGTCNPGLQAYSGPCVLAPRDRPHEGRYASPILPVCSKCARDPRQRRNLIRALERGQAKRKAATQ